MKRLSPTLYQKMTPAVRTSVWFTICNFLQRGTALITVPIFTRLLTTEEYGICNIYFSWFEIFVLLTSLKLPYEGLNNGLIRYEEDKDGYTSAMAGLITVMTLAGAGIYGLFHHWIDQVTGLSSFIMLFMLIELFFNPPLFLWTNRERFDFRYRWPVVVSLISTVLSPAIAVLAVLHTPYKAEARIIATALVQGALGLVFYLVLFSRGRKFYQKEYWQFALRFNLPLLFFYLSQTLLNQSDRIMINYFVGSGKAGIYSVAYSAATIMLLLVSAINGSFQPWMYKKLKAQCYHEVGDTAVTICLIVAGATLAMSAFAPDLIRILATADYQEAIWIVPPVSASVFFIFLYSMFANVEMYYGENRYISVISIICSLANLVLNAIFIPLCGYLAAGWTTLACYILLAVLHYTLTKRACRMHQAPVAIFRQKAILLIALVVFALSFVTLGLYTLGYFRYAALAIALAVLFCFRSRLAAALKHIRQ